MHLYLWTFLHAHMLRGHLRESVLSWSHGGLRNQTQVFKFGSFTCFAFWLGILMMPPRSATLSSLLGQPGKAAFYCSPQFSLGSHALIFGITISEEDIQGLASLHIPTPLWSWWIDASSLLHIETSVLNHEGGDGGGGNSPIGWSEWSSRWVTVRTAHAGCSLAGEHLTSRQA